MNEYLIAIRKTAGQAAVASISALILVWYFSIVTPEIFAYTVSAILFFGGLYTMYRVNLDSIRFDRRMKEIDQRASIQCK